MNSIPLPFAAMTSLHAQFTSGLEPAALRIFQWLFLRCKPGVAQEFDKADYDEYCSFTGRRKISERWFRYSVKRIIDTRLVQLVYEFKNYKSRGYKVKTFHPWELDDWVLDDVPKKNSANTKHKNANSNVKTSNKQTSNSDSTVPSYRESREERQYNASTKASTKTSTKTSTENSKPVPKPILKKIVAPSFSNSQEKCDLSQEKGKVDTCGGQTELNGLKTDLKLNSDDGRAAPATAVRKLDGQQVKSARVEEKVKQKPVIDEKIKNKQWRSHLDQLDKLGVQENSTIRKAVKTSSSDRVEAAIALYRNKKRQGYIEYPCGYFMQALKEDWARKSSKQAMTSPQTPEDKAAMFNYWYDLAKELGYCTGRKEVDGDRMVCMSGTWEKFEDAVARGYTLEYLRKVKKRNTNP